MTPAAAPDAATPRVCRLPPEVRARVVARLARIVVDRLQRQPPPSNDVAPPPAVGSAR